MKQLLCMIIFLGYQCYTYCTITCKDPNGKDVDWFIVYKVPKLTNARKYPVLTTGTEFFYMDTTSPKFNYKTTDIRSTTQNPVFETLKPLYTNKSKRYNYSNNQTRYGQTILCVTVRKAVENDLKNIFGTTLPYIYDRTNFDVNTLNRPSTSHVRLKSRGNVQLEVLAKSATYKEDIYEKWIAPELKDNFLARTWRPNPKKNPPPVINVKEVCFNNNIAFSDGVDHSKWAVAKQSPWICIGDLNREEAQKRRGGLSVCLKDAIAAKEFRDLHDKCINSMIKTANAKLPKRPKPPKRPILGVKRKPLKKQKGRKTPILAKNNRG
uniref:Uncharacterized protein n=1 Tax=Magallana gigas TaxID=29159 RepID=A0A8W8P3Q4_MAGGI